MTDQLEHRLAEVADYDALIAAFRARMVQIGVTHEILDALGFAKGHSAKLLAGHRTKNLGPQSFDMFLQFLGLRITLSDDPDTPAQIKAFWHGRIKRLPSKVLNASPLSIRMRKLGKLGADRRNERLSPAHRSRIARKAASARWGAKNNRPPAA